MGKTKNFSFVLWFITIAIGLIASAIIYKLLTFASAGQEFIFRPWLILVAFLLSLIHQIIYPLFFVFALRSIGRSAKYSKMIWISMFSSSANSTVPFPAVFPIRATLQKRIFGISYTASASAMFLEMIITFGGTAFVGAIFTLIWLRPEIGEQIAVIKAPVLVAILVLGAILTAGLVYWVAQRVKGRLFERLRDARNLIYNANPLSILLMVAVLLSTFALILFRVSAVLYSVNVYVHPGQLFAAVIISYFLGVVSFVPMGLGVYDLSLGSMLAMLGAPVPNVAAAIAIDRFISIAPYLVGGVIATHVLGKDVIDNTHEKVDVDEKAL